MSHMTMSRVTVQRGSVKKIKDFEGAEGGFRYIWDKLNKKYGSDGVEIVEVIDQMSKVERLVLGSTFDFCIIESQKLRTMADMFEEFAEDDDCLLRDWAKTLRGVNRHTCQGVCMWQTSDFDNPWAHYSTFTMDKHFYLFEEFS